MNRKIATIAMSALAVATTVTGAPARAQDDTAMASTESELTLARAIVDRAFPADRREAMFQSAVDQMQSQMMASMKQQIPDEGALQLVRDFQEDLAPEQKAILIKHIPKLMDGLALSYSELFTTPRLRDILAFVSTDSGQAFMLKGSEILSSAPFAEANQAFMDETMAVTMKRVPDFVEKVAAYKAQQAETTEQ